MREFTTRVETEFEGLRVSMLKDGYSKDHLSLQLLALLRTALKNHGYSFQPLDDKDQGN